MTDTTIKKTKHSLFREIYDGAANLGAYVGLMTGSAAAATAPILGGFSAYEAIKGVSTFAESATSIIQSPLGAFLGIGAAACAASIIHLKADNSKNVNSTKSKFFKFLDLGMKPALALGGVAVAAGAAALLATAGTLSVGLVASAIVSPVVSLFVGHATFASTVLGVGELAAVGGIGASIALNVIKHYRKDKTEQAQIIEKDAVTEKTSVVDKIKAIRDSNTDTPANSGPKLA